MLELQKERNDRSARAKNKEIKMNESKKSKEGEESDGTQNKARDMTACKPYLRAWCIFNHKYKYDHPTLCKKSLQFGTFDARGCNNRGM